MNCARPRRLKRFDGLLTSSQPRPRFFFLQISPMKAKYFTRQNDKPEMNDRSFRISFFVHFFHPFQFERLQISRQIIFEMRLLVRITFLLSEKVLK